MNKYEEGQVVITDSGQAGTINFLTSTMVSILLANGNMWHGSPSRIRHPQDQADLDACVLEVDRFIGR